MSKKYIVIICMVAFVVIAAGCNSFNPPMPTYNVGANDTLPPPTDTPEPATSEPPLTVAPNTLTPSPTPDETETPDPGATQTPAVVNVWVNGDAVNMRERANTDSNRLGQYNKGAKLELLEKGENWWKVTDGTRTGYIRKDFLSETEIN